MTKVICQYPVVSLLSILVFNIFFQKFLFKKSCVQITHRHSHPSLSLRESSILT